MALVPSVLDIQAYCEPSCSRAAEANSQRMHARTTVSVDSEIHSVLVRLHCPDDAVAAGAQEKITPQSAPIDRSVAEGIRVLR